MDNVIVEVKIVEVAGADFLRDFFEAGKNRNTSGNARRSNGVSGGAAKAS